MKTVECDVLVAGSGAGGLTATLAAAARGLNVILVEKEAVFGGTTAFAAGMPWIPANPGAAAKGDTAEKAFTYLQHEVGNRLDEAKAKTYLATCNEAIAFLESETPVRFTTTPGWADYHSELPGAAQELRGLLPVPYDGRRLGKNFSKLRSPLSTMMLFGGMMVGRSDVPHLMGFRTSLKSTLYVTKMMLRYGMDRLSHARGTRLTNGNALVAGLATRLFERDLPLWLNSPLRELVVEDGKVVGGIVERDGERVMVRARKGVVLACGGFPWSKELLSKHYPHVAAGKTHVSAAPVSNQGDGVNLGLGIGGKFDSNADHAAAWAPVSLLKLDDGTTIPYPHFLDRGKPGVIAVTKSGKRFVNEAVSYHDFVPAMIEACGTQQDVEAYVVASDATFKKYGLGAAPGAPAPIGKFIKAGYLIKAKSLAELAQKTGISATGLEATVREFNVGARQGVDKQFGKGSTAYQRFNGDPRQKPNPNVGPVGEGPYYAVRVVAGDLGTFMGLGTNEDGQVLQENDQPIAGLYACGNDAASVWSGHYPGPGSTIGPAITFGYRAARHMSETA
jgi:succinate dehydrogenase/fumarate reductase flavoprotein subunit